MVRAITLKERIKRAVLAFRGENVSNVGKIELGVEVKECKNCVRNDLDRISINLLQEAIFRAKPVDGGDWIAGVPIICSEDDGNTSATKMITMDDDGMMMIVTVFPGSIQQYIRMKDNNGDMIFEGDFVETNGGSRLRVTYVNGVYGPFNTVTGRDVCVIGNSWDNPGLIILDKEVSK